MSSLEFGARRRRVFRWTVQAFAGETEENHDRPRSE